MFEEIEITKGLEKEYRKKGKTLLKLIKAKSNNVNLKIEKVYDKYEVCYKIDKLKKVNSKIKDNTISFDALENYTYAIYGYKRNLIPFYIGIMGLMLITVFAKEAYSNIPEFRDKIQDIFVDTLKMAKPTEPIISGGSDIWTKQKTITIVKDSKSYEGISYYEYCITKEKEVKNCSWKKTDAKNVVVYKDGEYYVTLRGVSKKGTKGKNSDYELVRIDNGVPVVENLEIEEKTGKVNVKIKATDKLSGINKIYYKIDDNEYVEVEETFNIKIEGKHKITIKVTDHAGNFIEITKEIETENPQRNENKNEVEEQTNNENETLENPTNNENDNNSSSSEEEKELKVPIINLNKVPKMIYYKDEYEIPSYYWFDEMGGNVVCKVNDKEVRNTNEIELGTQLIICEAIGNNGLTAKVEKEIEVTQELEENFIFDGWIMLTLFYPENSVNQEWRIANENDIRTGIEKESVWNEYTGPIKVKLSNVENVFIRYTIDGVTYVKSPNGKLVVDIEPMSYCVNKNQSTSVSIYYEQGTEEKEYKINDGEWTKYKGKIQIEAGTLIEARGIKDEKVYDSEGEYQYTKKRQGTDSIYISLCDEKGKPTNNGGYQISGVPSESQMYESGVYVQTSSGSVEYKTRSYSYLEGPTISSNPKTLSEEVEVKITTAYPSKEIYYSIDGGKYQKYTEEFKVRENCEIKAYYIRESDGKRSDTTYYYVQNIKQESKPYVKIEVTPNRILNKNISKAEVIISGSDYERLEYSYDGNIWNKYETPIEVTRSCTVYARAIDAKQEVTYDKAVITTEKEPIVKEEYEVSIHANPSATEVKGLINKTEISIDYDKRATKRYYTIGYYGDLKEYKGPFTLEENKTIYAYAESETGYGEAKLRIDYLTTGISSPIIEIEPDDNAANRVKVEIAYAKTAKITKYKIDNREWLDYNGSFEVEKNCTIYAMNEDELGNKSTSSRQIKNIAYIPQYTLIDKGSYFVLKLNYPDSSEKTSREYKWAKNEWKKYDEDLGIILIKAQYKDIISKDGVKIKDSKGNEIIYKDHYYLVNVVDDNLMDSLLMRWDTGKPEAPEIKLSEYEPTKKLEVTIDYDSTSKVKKYKIVDSNGDSGWLDYKGTIKVEENGTIIYAKGQNSAEAWGKLATRKITNIDDEAPEVGVRGDFENPKQKVIIQIVGQDNLGIDKVGYKKGETTCEETTKVENNSTFEAKENGKYTICAIDKVGNTKREIIEVTNIDLTAPKVEINILTKTYGTVLEFEVEYNDSKTKQYKVGEAGSYKTYSGKVLVNANDILSLANEDGSLTIYAKGIDSAGNETEVYEKTYLIDLDAPSAPVINASAGYPTLTEYGVILDDKLSVSFDKRDDITNYISLDNGNSWKIYTGVEHINSGTIIAKSVKKESGLTVSTSKKIEQPSDAIEPNAYDDKDETYIETSYGKNKYIEIDKSVWNESLRVNYTANYNSVLSVTVIYTDGTSKKIFEGNDTLEFVIPENTEKIFFTGGTKIYELDLTMRPSINVEKIYPKLNLYNTTKPYLNINIEYGKTSKTKLYKIDEGEWQNYVGTVKLNPNQKITAKGIDKNGVETYTSEEIADCSDCLLPEAYDKDETTYDFVSSEKFVEIDESVWNQKITVIFASNYNRALTLNAYLSDGSIERLYYGNSKCKVIIPENTIKLSMRGENKIYDYKFEMVPEITGVLYNSILTSKKVEYAYNLVTINYGITAEKKLYKINDGEWKNYTGNVKIYNKDVIVAKSIDKEGNESSEATYTGGLISGGLDSKAYDGDETTYVDLTWASPVRVNISEEMKGQQMMFITYLQHPYSKVIFYNKDDKDISTVTSNLTNEIIYDIPSDAEYFIITRTGTSFFYLKEIYPIVSSELSPMNLEDNDESYKLTPKFNIKNISENEKEISINYANGYTNEYSIDGGITWNTYEGSVKLNKNSTVYARIIDENGKTISSSSIKITSIVEKTNDNPQSEKENVENDGNIPQEEIEISLGKDYELTSNEYPICKLDDEVINSVKDLEVGTYIIKCYNNENLFISKKIIIKE